MQKYANNESLWAWGFLWKTMIGWKLWEILYLIVDQCGNLCYNIGYRTTIFIWKSKAIIFYYLDSYIYSHLLAGEFKHFYGGGKSQTQLYKYERTSHTQLQHVDLRESGPAHLGSVMRTRTNGSFSCLKSAQKISFENVRVP